MRTIRSGRLSRSIEDNDVAHWELAMMPYQSYQLFEIERPKSIAEQRAADARRGEFAAAVSRWVRATTAQLHATTAPRRLTRGSGRPATARSAS
jgi:hypothetical protein